MSASSSTLRRGARSSTPAATSPWLRLAVVAGVVTAAASFVGIVAAGRVYRDETNLLTDAAGAQDVVDLLAAAPLMIMLALGARRSARARLALPGCAAFTAYNFAIYAFAIHFGPLFLPWVAALGLSVFTLIGALAGLATTRSLAISRGARCG